MQTQGFNKPVLTPVVALSSKSWTPRPGYRVLAVRQCTRVRYQDDDQSAPSKASPANVTAEDTYRAAAANMPQGAWAGRWERWAPPPGNKGGIVKADEESSGWQLLTSGAALEAAVSIMGHVNSCIQSTVDALPDYET